MKGITFYRAGSRGNEPLEIIDFKDINLDKLVVDGTTEEGAPAVDTCESGVCEI